MTTTTNETTIELDQDVPLVRIVREFDAPPEKVFRAHTDPELVARWLGPHAYEMTVDRWDCRPGGEYRYRHTGDGEEYAFRGCFHDVVPDERIVQTFTFQGMPEHVALETIRFEALPGGRTRLVGESLVGSFADRDAFVASGMEQGVREGYERLDDVLAG
jgi:uncharacterized protein YndB with AHSA1/START domain